VDQLKQMLAPQQQAVAAPQGMAPGAMPGMPPQAAPQMPQMRAARGGSIESLRSNLGSEYHGGGIVAFAGEDESYVKPKRQYTLQEQGADWEARLQAVRDAEEANRSPESIKDSEGIVKALKFVGSLPIEALKTLVSAPGYGLSSKEPAKVAAPVPAAVMPSFDKGTGEGWDQTNRPMPRPDQRSGTQGIATPITKPSAAQIPANLAVAPGPTMSEAATYLQSSMTSPEAARTAEEARARAAYGAPDTTGYDRAVSELEKRRSQFEAPKTGMPALMEYLSQIAQAPRGMGSLSAGALGAQRVEALQKQREGTQFDLTKQILEQEQKKMDATRGYAKEIYGIGKAEYDARFKTALEAAKQITSNEAEAKRLAQQALDNQLNRENNLMMERERERGATARHGMPSFSDTQKQSLISEYMQRNPKASRLEAAAAVNAAMSGVAVERQDLSELRALQKTYTDQADVTKNPNKASREDAAARLAIVNRKLEAMAGIGPSTTTGGKMSTLPPGFKLD
jgi:hypothetical protein